MVLSIFGNLSEQTGLVSRLHISRAKYFAWLAKGGKSTDYEFKVEACKVAKTYHSKTLGRGKGATFSCGESANGSHGKAIEYP